MRRLLFGIVVVSIGCLALAPAKAISLNLNSPRLTAAPVEKAGYLRRQYRRYGYPAPYYPPAYGYYPPPAAYAYPPPAYGYQPPPPVAYSPPTYGDLAPPPDANGNYPSAEGDYGDYPPAAGDYPPAGGEGGEYPPDGF